MGKKIISFCLWGDNPKYTIGAVKNAELALEIYPDWICRFYIGSSTPISIVNQLKAYRNTEVIEMEENGSNVSTLWRFLPVSESDVDIMLSRDTDSRLSLREKIAVDEWINSDKGFHIMRDHPWHCTEILAGMWGCKSGIIKNIVDSISSANIIDRYGTDQVFLKDMIYPIIKNNCFVHDEFFSYDADRKPFPTKRENYEFVGDVFDSTDKRDDNFWRHLINT